ncbi:MAG: alpha/beta hydrolase [Planctomycetota bacterium]
MRSLLVALAACLVTPACRFGLDYSGDDRNLLRETVASEGHELSYLRAGDGTRQRVIFIHGSPGLGAMYSDYLRELGPRAEVLAVDRLGYGASAGSGTVVSFEEQAAAIAPLLVERNGRWPIVVGHSLGGPIAARLAADFPDRVGALVIVAGGLDPELEETHWYNEVARWRVVQPFLAEFLKVSNREMWACRDEVERLDPLLARIACPVFVIHGTADTLVPYEVLPHTIDRFADQTNLTVVVLIGEEHRVTALRREEVREVIEHILRGGGDYLEVE